VTVTIFVQLGLNLSNEETDALESSSVLIYLVQVKSIYTQIKLGVFNEKEKCVKFNLRIVSYEFWDEHQTIVLALAADSFANKLYFFTKPILMMRSTVLSLSLQLEFPA